MSIANLSNAQRGYVGTGLCGRCMDGARRGRPLKSILYTECDVRCGREPF